VSFSADTKELTVRACFWSCKIDFSGTRRANLTEHPTVNKVGNGSKVPYLDVVLAFESSYGAHRERKELDS